MSMTDERLAVVRAETVEQCREDRRRYGPGTTVNDHGIKEELLAHIDEQAAKIKRLTGDLRDAAGELLVDIPEPGTPMSKVVIANKLLRNERDALRAEVERLRFERGILYQDLAAFVGHTKKFQGGYPALVSLIELTEDRLHRHFCEEAADRELEGSGDNCEAGTCQASKGDGIICPHDSCDREDGVR